MSVFHCLSPWCSIISSGGIFDCDRVRRTWEIPDARIDAFLTIFEIMHACAGGTTAVLSTAEITQGSGAVAIVEIEMMDDGAVSLQVVGDEDIYGENYIIEPPRGVALLHLSYFQALLR
jgi:hypothetical protein